MIYPRQLYWLFTGLLLSLLLALMPFETATLPSDRAIAASSSVPVTTSWQNTPLPDFNNISFSSLPPFKESGSFQAQGDAITQLGYDPSFQWESGQSPSEVVALGSLDSFKLERFSLDEIASLTGIDLSSMTLKDFGVMDYQTLESLVKAIPDLKDWPIGQLPPINDLLSSQLLKGFDFDQTIGDLLQDSLMVGQIKLSNLSLENYPLDSIPKLGSTPLGSFSQWQAVKVARVPGLDRIPFSQFPAPPNPIGGTTGTVDIAFATPEQQANRTISGSDVEGFNVACHKDCAHIELSGNLSVRGRQWVSGKYQQVRGGYGVLGSVNGGMEPTGRFLFGNDAVGAPFKVAVWDISETQGTVSQALFFRFCSRSLFVDLGCTPYFIGPVPWLTYREGSPIFLGSTPTTGVSRSVSTPTGAPDNPGPSTFTKNPNNSTLAFLRSVKKDCNKQNSGVVLDALSVALSEIEGNHDSVGAYVCDFSGNCGRGLGAKQFMSYRQDVQNLIASKPGGNGFLTELGRGTPVQGEQMLQYFPPSDQEDLFEQDVQNLLTGASSQIDPQTGLPFGDGTKERLIQRVAQMHFGGPAVPVDSGVSDVHGRLTIFFYGQTAARNYGQALSLLGCQST